MFEQLRQILSFLDGKARIGLAVVFALTFVATILEMAGLGLLLPFLQMVAEPRAFAEKPLGEWLLRQFAGDSRAALLAVCGAVAVFFVLKNAYLLAVAWIQNRYSMMLVAHVSQIMLERVMVQPFVTVATRNSSELIRNIRHLVAVTFAKGLRPFLGLLLEATTGVGVLLVLLLVEPLATLLVTALLAVVMVLYSWAMRGRLQMWGEQQVEYEGKIQLWLQQSLGAIKPLRLTGRTRYFTDVYGKYCRRRAHIDVHSQTMPHVPRLLLETLSAIGLVTVVVMFLMQGREPAEALPSLGVFAVAALRVAPSLSRLISNMALMRESRKSVALVHQDFHAMTVSVPVAGPDVKAWAWHQGITLDHVSFTYPGAVEPALQDVSLTIPRGSSVALVGRSGAGKSTLADVILGLLSPQSGRVLVDGADIAADLPSWQRGIGYIPQTIYLIDDTLRRNIALGVPDSDIDEERLRNACRLAQLDDLVARLPQGVDTVIGEHGGRLSGGQRQRIGIARALYDDPGLLVLDEATSALDTETEHEISQAIADLSGIKTVIVIAHRLSTVRHCDAVVLMEKGVIRDQGTFSDLLGRDDMFRNLVEKSSMPDVERHS